MNILTQIIKKLSSGLEQKYDSELLNRFILINLFSFLGLIYLFLFSIINFAENENTIGIISIVFGIIILVNLVYLKKTENYNNTRLIGSIAFTLFLGYLFLSGGIETSGYIWIFLYPPFMLFMLDYNNGLRMSSLFLLFILLSFLIPDSIQFIAHYTLNLKIRIVASYLGMTLIIYFYEYLKIEAQKNLEKFNLDTRKEIKEKAEFISKLSYQIRTPLSNILGVTTILNETQLDEKQRELVDTIEASVNNLVTVVNRIDEASDEKIDNQKNENLTFNLYTAINSTLDLFSNRKQGIRFNFNYPVEIPQRLIGNPIKIKQIFLNIIELYIKYNPNVPLFLTVNLSKNQQNENNEIECLFEIKSDIPLSFPIELNNPVNNDLSYDSLDLSITSNLIESTRGKLKFKKEKEIIICQFTIPLRLLSQESKISETQKNEKSINSNITTPVELKDSNVLLVEDNEINQKIMVLSLKKEVKNIEIANNGKEALEKFAKSKFDIILMDVQMPVMDGIKTTQKIREAEEGTNSHVPIIAITAYALAGDKEECLSAGMDDYISKPFQLKVVLEKMKYHLSKNKSFNK